MTVNLTENIEEQDNNKPVDPVNALPEEKSDETGQPGEESSVKESEEELAETPVAETADELSSDEEDEKDSEDVSDDITESEDEEISDDESGEIAEEVPAAEVEPVPDASLMEMQFDESGVFKWYAVRIIAGHENKVKTYLDAQIKEENLQHKIRNVLIPLEKVFEVKGGKKKVKMKNFLPGYILIEADLDDKIRRFISHSPSVLNMVGSKSVKGQKLEPISLKESEVKRIRAILNEESQTEKIDLRLSVGDPVKVISGPFNNFNGNILEVNTEKMKVKVMVSIFGRKTPIELEFTQIEKEK